jgi:hypothetical protein
MARQRCPIARIDRVQQRRDDIADVQAVVAQPVVKCKHNRRELDR